jgi:hypothetical protein
VSPTIVAPERLPAVAAIPAQTLPSVSRRLPASPAPSVRPTVVPARSGARLEHANALFESRHYQSALNEARAVLAQQPGNEEARALAEDAAAALLVEERLRKARAAAERGDRTTALAEVRAGLAAAPNDARLLALQKQLTR